MPGNDEGHVTVNAYSGYKANERPINFTMGEETVRIVDILEFWAEPNRDCFKVRGDNRKKYSMFWIRDEDKWQIKEAFL